MDSELLSTTQTTVSWCKTLVNVAEVNFYWTINNFSFCNEKSGEPLESSVFSALENESVKWRLQFYPSGNNVHNKDYVSLFLHLVGCDRPAIKADFFFYILDANGQEVNERKTIEKWQFYQGRESGFPKFVKRSFVLDAANGLLVDDQLRLLCRIRSATGSVERLEPEQPRAPAREDGEQLAADLGELLRSGRFSDVTLEACDGAKFPAHKSLLCARSPVFAAMFEHDMLESRANAVRIRDVDAGSLEAMLGFIYTAKVEDLGEKAFKLLGAADIYALDALKDACERLLCESLSVEDAAECLMIAELYNASRLRAKAQSFIRAHLKDVLETSGFKLLTSSLPRSMEGILRSMVVP